MQGISYPSEWIEINGNLMISSGVGGRGLTSTLPMVKYIWIIRIHKLNILEMCPFVWILLYSKHLLQLFFIVYNLLTVTINGYSSPSLSDKYSRCENIFFSIFSWMTNTSAVCLSLTSHQQCANDVYKCKTFRSISHSSLSWFRLKYADSSEVVVEGNLTFISVKFTFQ